MPTTITGSPTGTASPSAQPDPDTVPVLSAPADGEADAAASVNQAFTALANEVAYGKRPTAGAPSNPTGLDARFVQPIKAYRNARGKRRDFVDHRGFVNMAKISRWQERWDDVALVTKSSAGNGAWAGKWNYGIHAGGGATPQIYPAFFGVPSGPGVIPPYAAGSVVLDTGNVTSSGIAIACVEANPLTGVWITEDADMAMSVDVIGYNGGSGTSNECAVGFLASVGDPVLTTTSALFATTAPIGIAIVMRLTDTNWQLYTCLSAGSPTYTDLGTAAISRLRLEYQGANTSDDGAARVLVYKDGNPIKNFAVDMTPADPANSMLYYPFFWQASTGGRGIGRYGVVDFAAARMGGDIAY